MTKTWTIPPHWYEIYYPRFWGTLPEFEKMMIRVLRKRFHNDNTRVRWGSRAKRLNKRAELCSAPGRVTGNELRVIVKYYDSRCAYCEIELDFENSSNGRDDSCATFDHVKPLGRGGTGNKSNLVPSCLLCNNKRSKWPDSALGVPAPKKHME